MHVEYGVKKRMKQNVDKVHLKRLKKAQDKILQS